MKTIDDTVLRTNLIRLGILCLPLGAVLKLVGNLGTFNSIGYGIPQSAEAATASGAGFFVGELVGSIVPVLLTPFWVFALFIAFLPSRRPRTLIAAMVSSLIGAGITLPALGVVNYAFPALAVSYRAGNSGAMDIVDSFFTWPRGAMVYPAVLVPIGTVLFAVAIWRSPIVPRTAMAMFAATAILISIPVPLHAVRLTGGFIGLGVGCWITVLIWRNVGRTIAPLTPQAAAIPATRR